MYNNDLTPHSHFQTISTPSSSSSCTRPSFNEKPTHYAPYGFSGDGWSQMLLPIPPEVEDPYEFLRQIQAHWDRQSAKVAAKSRHSGGASPSRGRFAVTYQESVLSDEDAGIWECFLRLPTEVWKDIAEELCRAGCGHSLACTSRAFNELVAPIMYSTPVLSSLSSLTSFLDTMSAHCDATALTCINASSITSLSLQLTSIDWNKAEQLGKTLRTAGPDIKTLRVQCAGSDLERAKDVFAHFNPEVFEWHTAPCWLIRPAKVFEEILLAWPQLHTLRLSGFFWDANFISTLVNLPKLQTLHLSGRTMSSLSWDCLRELLDPGASKSLQLKQIYLSDLPPGKASSFDDENEALHHYPSCYFSRAPSGTSTRTGSLSPPATSASAVPPTLPPYAYMIRSSSVDSGIDFMREMQSSSWPWRCENRDYSKDEGRGSMRWWRQ